MNDIIELLNSEAEYLGNGIIRVDSILNHQVNIALIDSFAQSVLATLGSANCVGITKVVTAEASGISPAYALSQKLNVPMIYARKSSPITMADAITESVTSRTKPGESTLSISARYLGEGDRVILIDDFLGSGSAAEALIKIVNRTSAKIVALACLIEKGYEGGRKRVEQLQVPVISMLKVDIKEESLVFSSGSSDLV